MTARQRLVLLVMVMAIVGVFGLLGGVIATTIRGWRSASPAATPTSFSFLLTPSPGVPTATARPAPTAEPGWTPLQAARVLDQVERQVEILRGLAPQAEVPLNFFEEREMVLLLRGLYGGRDLEDALQPYVALGLFPRPAVVLDVQGVAGIYVPEQGQLYVTIGGLGSGTDGRVLLAHTYVHALQGQHFDPGAAAARATTTDASLALRALVEGDATFLTALYRYEDLAEVDWEVVAELGERAEVPGYGKDLESSAAWARLRGFPYREGRHLVEVLFQAGGWAAVNRAYADPPRSTEQVLHPERYMEGRDDPVAVSVPDLSGVLGVDWEMSLKDTMGELVVGLYLAQVLPPETAWQAADGWGGDSLVVWEGEEGQVRVWRSVWDRAAEAAEFERALVASIPQRALWAVPADPPVGQSGRWWETDSEAVAVFRVARFVVLATAPDADLLAQAVAALP